MAKQTGSKSSKGSDVAQRSGGFVSVPENLSSGLRLLPEGPAEATVDKVMVGTSKKGMPKATFKYIITEEMDNLPDDEPTAIGEAVLETFSLQSQALFKLNDAYKEVTGDRLKMGDYSKEEIEALLNETFVGTSWTLMLQNQVPTDGSSDEERTVIVSKKFNG